MTADDTQTLNCLRRFLDEVHLARPDDLPEVAAHAAADLGWTLRLYVVDHEQSCLVPLPAPSVPDAAAVAIDGTLAGRAFRRVEQVPAPGPEPSVWVPLVDGVHRLGVLQYGLPAGTDLDDPVVQDRLRLLSHVVGHLVVAKSPYGDAFDLAARRRHRTVPTELLHALLPPLTFGCPGLLVSGILEPCYDVAADAFDYSVVDGVAHLAVLDAMGHDLRGTLVAAVALSAYRNGRREGLPLSAVLQRIDDAIADEWEQRAFATGVLAELDLATGRLRYVNAGHPAPLLMRRGKVVKQLAGGRRIVLGLGDGRIDVAEEWLEPDDWAVFYTDGITEARDADGRFYGLERLTDQLERSGAAGEPAPETLRQVVHAVLRHHGDHLQDDATLLVAQWASGREQDLTAG
ncbi:PP2C family protein-serine/threonine phosphatase [Cellulomonas sp. NPDC057328]|uniref:PP2C family protein-serine/threonine phosphatase n=1 Tax=Cellulomonas sp. NPDC057328 TaxID=3346101 RepID=UPI00363630B1